MKKAALLITRDGNQVVRDLADKAIYYGGRYQGEVGTTELDPMILVVEWEQGGFARSVFTYRMEESYREETGNLPVYCEMSWVSV